MRVQNKPIGTLGMANQVETIDAHSLQKGDFTEARNVGGQPVYLTKAGAEALDALVEAGFELKASADPGWLSRKVLGDFVGAKGEQHQGSVR
ncbi:MAG: hypothetical protein JNK82_39850 [Myxococcaceae bacterium]|nr:hypothetical protein [Myxococcaceae bacterium]